MAPLPPPDLKVLCRKLASIPPAQLPTAIPSLSKHIIRCRDVLSSPQDPKTKDDRAQSAQLVHAMRTSVTSLLNGRSCEGRFAAIGLVKAIIDVGGWEMLHTSDTWVRGLLSIVQKGDPFASKELAILTLTHIYVAVQPYQTLVREIATATIPTFITACLQLIKPHASGRAPAPLSTVETICGAFSTLIPLYPATFRPNSSAMRSAIRCYLAPTLTDDLLAPQSLQRAARKLVISLPHVAAKSNGGDEWAKLVDGLLRELHATGDQVLRAVDESWEGTSGYTRHRVDPEVEPAGGSGSGDQLPRWTSLASGVDRLVGIFQYLADCLSYPTKSSVMVPISALMDAVSRVCLIARLNPKSQTWDQALETNAAISREEKEELWSCMPDIHLSALALTSQMLHRFGQGMTPLIPEILDHLVRVFKSGIANPAIRMAGYDLLNSILTLVGPTMSRAAVGSIEPLIAACCRDLQEDAGFLKPSTKPSTASATDAKKKKGSGNSNNKSNSLANADLFLQPQAHAAETSISLEPPHKAAANGLLTSLLSNLPQHHLKPTLRGLMDKTAILARNRDAMVASVLNPYKDQRGRMYPTILPHLSQQYPHDQGLEILRSNLRTSSTPSNTDMLASVTAVEQDSEDDNSEDGHEDDQDEEMRDADEPLESTSKQTLQDVLHSAAQQSETMDGNGTASLLPVQSNPFEAKAPNTHGSADESRSTTAESPAKRKHEDAYVAPSKRQETAPPAVLPATVRAEDDESGDDSDGSVHLNMELDDDDDDDDEDEPM
ncbi:hypothetical protein E4U57_004452 [Claviceps arundinis]|uniref:Pre-rRNA-processing protein RIX1 n=1 Tax=Claviceps arundinis TaxID=1623583 RepID=A0A9P7SU37_9HYPO|nr:hypothetical protein E4U57_004452 [Claviceps arundinis]KAG5975981.1 hypothetical protein E4U56_002646 [Claviceps arundinis]